MARRLAERNAKKKADREAQLNLQSGASQPEQILSTPMGGDHSAVLTASSGCHMENILDSSNKKGRGPNDAVQTYHPAGGS